MTEEHEAVRCLQCDWPILRGQVVSEVLGECSDCGLVHPIGWVHTALCAHDLYNHVDRALTQKRRAGAIGAN